MEITRKDFKLERFPNGEFKLIIDKNIQGDCNIVWRYGESFADGMKLNSPAEEMVALIYLNELIERVTYGKRVINLYADYLPFRRQDKRKLLGEVEFDTWTRNLDSLNIIESIPHNITNDEDTIFRNTMLFLKHVKVDDMVIIPDHGASLRFDRIELSRNSLGVMMFNKTRDAKTGALSFDKLTPDQKLRVKGKRCVIIDDIVSYGGTFKHIGFVLKVAGAKHVKLVVNHSDGVMDEKEMKKNGIDEIVILNGGL